MILQLFQRTAVSIALAVCMMPAMGQDLIARQAPIDRKMRAVDSVEIQRLFQQEDIASPCADLYPSWDDAYINMYGGVQLPSEYKIDLRGFYMPTDNRIVTSGYGYRPRFRRQHKGIDINAYKGDTIRAAFDGKVRIVTFQRGGYGNVVVIRHPNGLETVYGHLSKHLTKKDKSVKAGDPIGLAGSTGRSTGTHLHFETRFLGEYIDPAKLFDFEHQDVKADYYIFKGRGRGTLLGMHESDQTTDDALAQAETEEEVTYNSTETVASKRNSRAAQSTRIHKVRKGETLGSIARKRGTTVAKLCRANGISKNATLRVGQILKFS